MKYRSTSAVIVLVLFLAAAPVITQQLNSLSQAASRRLQSALWSSVLSLNEKNAGTRKSLRPDNREVRICVLTPSDKNSRSAGSAGKVGTSDEKNRAGRKLVRQQPLPATPELQPTAMAAASSAVSATNSIASSIPAPSLSADWMNVALDQTVSDQAVSDQTDIDSCDSRKMPPVVKYLPPSEPRRIPPPPSHALIEVKAEVLRRSLDVLSHHAGRESNENLGAILKQVAAWERTSRRAVNHRARFSFLLRNVDGAKYAVNVAARRQDSMTPKRPSQRPVVIRDWPREEVESALE